MRVWKAVGIALVLIGTSGLALTGMVIREPGPVDAYYEVDPLDPPPPSSMDAWIMGLVFAGIAGSGVWLLRAEKRAGPPRRRDSHRHGAAGRP
jgi:hypothetical protein